MIKKYLEVKSYEYLGVEVLVKIDYDKKSISLVESIPHGIFLETNYRFVDKKWLFSNRGLEYMGRWIHVIEAMHQAVEMASKELEQYLKDVQKDKENQAGEILDMAIQMVKRNQKPIKNKAKK